MKNQNEPTRLARLIALITLPLLISAHAMAIGIIIPIPRPDVPVSVPPTLQSIDVSGEIKNDVARTRITQVFHNPNPRPVEADFYFPVPDGADITDFVLYMNGKPVKGEVLDKDKAQEIYRDIVRKLRDPGLVEWADKNLFRVRIFPIPAHGEQKIEIELSQALTADQGYYRYVLPMKSARHPAASTPLAKAKIDLTIEADSPVRNVYSPTHKIDTTTPNPHRVNVTIKEIQADEQKDFILYYEKSNKDIAVSLLAHRTAPSEGFFSLRISPPWDANATTAPKSQPADYVFVIDSSGSMAEGAKIDQARKALRYCVGLLGPADRFNVIRFSTTVDLFKPDLLPALPENRAAATEWIDGIQARGGTNISEALKTSLAQRSDKTTTSSSETNNTASSLFTVVFLTDGLPTVGQTSPDVIIKDVEKQSGGNVRIFSFGVGNDVNTRLLDSIADSTRAASEYVAPDADLELPVSRFFDKVSRPALFNLELKIPGAGVTEIYPARLPDLFYGTELTVFGRYKNSGPSPIILSGTIAGKTQEYQFEKIFPEISDANPFVEKLWATRKVAWLIDEVRKAGESKELRKEIEELAHKYSIVTPYTSFLAMEDSAAAPLPASRNNLFLFGQRNARVDESKSPAASPALSAGRPAISEAMDFKRQSGERAVQTAQHINRMKTADTISPGALEATASDQKTIGGKTFIMKNGVWKDTKITDTKDSSIKIIYLSDAWFQISEHFPQIQDFLSLGEQVHILMGNNTVLQIGTEGLDSIDEATKMRLQSVILETY